jgi:metal transporter CNNM
VVEILRKGYSRIPVYEPSATGTFMFVESCLFQIRAHKYSGCLTIRGLVGYDASDLQPVSALATQMLPQCPPDLTLIEGMSCC